MKISELSTMELDILVARLERIQIQCDAHNCLLSLNEDGAEVEWTPSNNWLQGGPILERNNIVVGPWKPSQCAATIRSFPESAAEVGGFGNTYLEAGMRCYVASMLGDEIAAIPELGNEQ